MVNKNEISFDENHQRFNDEIVVKYEELGYKRLGPVDTIKYQTINELHSNPLFKLYYQEYSSKYKKIIDTYLELCEKVSFRIFNNCNKSPCEIEYSILTHLLTLDKFNFDYIEYLNGKSYFDTIGRWTDLVPIISGEFVNNPQMIDVLKKMVYNSENQNHLPSYLIRGIMLSNNQEAIEIVFNLLKNSEFNDRLRTNIIWNIDEGSLETYKLFLNLVREDDLLRFSSVKKYFYNFTGHYSDVIPKDYTLRANYVIDCLVDGKTKDYLDSRDPLKIYVGLYALSCEGRSKVLDYISQNYETAHGYQSVCFHFFLNLSSTTVDSKIVTKLLQNEEPLEIKSMLLALVPNLSFENDERKKEYLLTYLENCKKIKFNTKYMLFEDSYYIHVPYTAKYDFVLACAHELGDDEVYEKAYAIYEQFSRYNDDVHFDAISHPAQRKALIRCLSTRNIRISDIAFNAICRLNLSFSEEEYFDIAKQLKSKRGDVRSNICHIFLSADQYILLKCVKYLIKSKNPQLHNGGLSILVDNLERVQDLNEFLEIKELVELTNFSHEAAEIKARVLAQESENVTDDTPSLIVPKLTWNPDLVKVITEYDLQLISNLIDKWWDMFTAHNGETVLTRDYDNTLSYKIIGSDILNMKRGSYKIKSDNKLYMTYYFYEQFINELDDLSDDEIAILIYMSELFKRYQGVSKDNSTSESHKLTQYKYYSTIGLLPDFEEVLSRISGEKQNLKILNYINILELIQLYKQEEHNVNLRKIPNYNNVLQHHLAFSIEKYKQDIELLPSCFKDSDNPNLILPFDLGNTSLNNLVYADDQFAFDLLRNLLSFYNEKYSPVSLEVYFYFLNKKFISTDYLVNKFLDNDFCKINHIKKPEIVQLSYIVGGNGYVFPGSKIKYSYLVDEYSLKEEFDISDCHLTLMHKVYNQVIEKMISVELQRTDRKTIYTQTLNNISVVYGGELYIKILDKMSNINFVRAYIADSSLGIKEICSSLLKKIRPEVGLNNEQFSNLVKTYNIHNKKLIEASIYNPYFIDLTANHLGIDALKKVVYFFKAHGLDNVSNITEDCKMQINRYTSFELEYFVDGLMDINWFKEIITEVDKEHYDLIYDSIQYTMDAPRWKRAKSFADAVNGKLSLKDIEQAIKDQRDQNMLLCLGLIPLGEGFEREQEAFRRYKIIQDFIVASKNFGVQRQAKETRCAEIALKNLAANFGAESKYFRWLMEVHEVSKIQQLFVPKTIGEIEMCLSFDNAARVQIVVSKDNKRLNSIPALYRNNLEVIELIETKKEMEADYKRVLNSFEQAMNDSSSISLSILKKMSTHPVIREVMSNILFICENFIGFLIDQELKDFAGNLKELTSSQEIRVAHCVDLKQNNWLKWQQYFLDNQLIQPFKQVFRELYSITNDELENHSFTNRFAGYQVERQKAIAIFDFRKWIYSYKGYFEQVNHLHNLRIRLYLSEKYPNATHFEFPSLGKVKFINNKTNEAIDLENISEIIFSEAMRDLDLAISVAYVGGIDPLLNHATIEMRKRIIEHNLKLFKITNYELEERHLSIEGSFGKYFIHLGSGIVSMDGKGMLPIMPAYRQKSANIFLPFVDDNSKTLEIITKAIILAEDHKLKDPSILQFIRNR